MAFIDQRLAIEVDGSRHLSFKQQRGDAEKRNALTERGWRVLSYPASAVTTKSRLPRIVEQIRRVLCGASHDADGEVLTN